MSELELLFSLLVGALLGVFFFGGLWWTVRWAVSSSLVGLWFFGSMLLRTAIVLAGFYLTCDHDWRRWLAALLGFIAARLAITRFTRVQVELPEGRRAS